MIPTKIVVASDSFKGSLSSAEVAECAREGIIATCGDCCVRCVTIADGGEGTVDALVGNLDGRRIEVTVNNPLMRPVKATYGIVGGDTAVIEMSAASGLPLIDVKERNPLYTSTYGTGELIKDALSRGCRKFLMGIGGSATNDAGMGMLRALGYRFYDAGGFELQGIGKDLNNVATIDSGLVDSRLAESSFTVACDVSNPLYGTDGAAFVFAPQKGASPDEVELLDRGLRHFADVVYDYMRADMDWVKGAGAAGGLGGCLYAFMNASLVSGIEMILDAIDFDTIVSDASLVITGEGKLDAQTSLGKAPYGVMRRAVKAGVPVVAIGGAVECADALVECGFDAVFPIISAPVSLADAMNPDVARRNVRTTVEQIVRTAKIVLR